MRTRGRLAKERETWRQHVATFRRAQSTFFAVDTEIIKAGRITRRLRPKKIQDLEEKRAIAYHNMQAAKRTLCQSRKRYLDIGDGTIVDCKTQLIGLKGACELGKKSWSDAMAAVSKLASGLCGLSDDSRPGDWRLPHKTELPVLFTWKQSGMFTAVQAYYYWSGSASVVTPSTARLINLYDGGVYNVTKSNSYYIWPIRGGP